MKWIGLFFITFFAIASYGAFRNLDFIEAIMHILFIWLTKIVFIDNGKLENDN